MLLADATLSLLQNRDTSRKSIAKHIKLYEV